MEAAMLLWGHMAEAVVGIEDGYSPCRFTGSAMLLLVMVANACFYLTIFNKRIRQISPLFERYQRHFAVRG
jgi:hypothetical protein